MSDVSVNEQTKVRLPLLMLLALLVGTASAVLGFAAMRNTDADHERLLVNHEDRLRRIEENQTDLAIIKNDIRWLRQREEQRRLP